MRSAPAALDDLACRPDALAHLAGSALGLVRGAHILQRRLICLAQRQICHRVHIHAETTGENTESANAATVSHGELQDFADLPLRFGHVFRGAAERPGVRCFVDIRALAAVESAERLHFPRLPCKPGEHASLDIAEVSDGEDLLRGRDHASADAGGGSGEDVVIEQRSAVRLKSEDRRVHLFAVELSAREILRLEEAARPAASARGSAKLKASAEA